MYYFCNNFHNKFSEIAYKFMGCHFNRYTKEATFRVYAPNATKVYVVGDFCDWENGIEMNKITGEGIYEVNVKNVNRFDKYKFKIINNNKVLFKQDPYAFHNETGEETCSKVYDFEFEWSDQEWMEHRKNNSVFNKPLNIYEVHLGSWKKNKDDTYYSYRMTADKLIPYVKKMGYTHIELMPLNEHPFDGSWGYQVTGYFSVTSRYGTPDDFMYLVNKAHEANIGIIMDWVPAHFPKDAFGLYEFDGDKVYEDPEPTRMEFAGWGTRIFNYAKPEVKSFLISSAHMLLDVYHIDGIRCDAVAAMLYLDYDRKKWIPNKFGGNYKLEAIDFFHDLNTVLYRDYPNIMMIAEESTAFPNVTKPVYAGGLGFSHKWNMGWMNDSLAYASINPFFRHDHHHKMTFSLCYAYSENYILPISHDEVVHGKYSLIDKMGRDCGGTLSYDEKFANDRAYLGYMMTHPGGKLLFMGCEFGQFIEWNYKKELDWFLVNKFPRHKEMQRYVEHLNKFYLKHSELWDNDQTMEGFTWINADDAGGNVYSFIRTNKKGKKLVVIINFSGNNYDYYRLGVPRGSYVEVFNSDLYQYGGNNYQNTDILRTEKYMSNNSKYSITVKIPRYSIIILKKR